MSRLSAALLIICALANSVGCAAINTSSAIVPDAIRAEVEHISHPLAGFPLNADKEDAVSTVGVVARWTRGHFYVEQGLGYKIDRSGFNGPDMTYAGRIGYEWRIKE